MSAPRCYDSRQALRSDSHAACTTANRRTCRTGRRAATAAMASAAATGCGWPSCPPDNAPPIASVPCSTRSASPSATAAVHPTSSMHAAATRGCSVLVSRRRRAAAAARRSSAVSRAAAGCMPCSLAQRASSASSSITASGAASGAASGTAPGCRASSSCATCCGDCGGGSGGGGGPAVAACRRTGGDCWLDGGDRADSKPAQSFRRAHNEPPFTMLL